MEPFSLDLKEEAEEMAVLAQRGDAAWDGVGDSRQPQA